MFTAILFSLSVIAIVVLILISAAGIGQPEVEEYVCNHPYRKA